MGSSSRDVMRFYRRDDMDLFEQQEAPRPIERLRELVDKLPLEQQHLVSRVFFGGAHLSDAAEEIEISDYRAKESMNRALKTLRAEVLKDHALGQVLSDTDRLWAVCDT